MPGGSISFDGFSRTFITLRGEPSALGMAVEEVTRPGVNGHAFREDARRSEPFVMEGMIDYPAFSVAEADYVTLKGKQGKVGSVVDDRGTVTSNVILLGVERQFLRPVRGNVGGVVVMNGAQALLGVRLRLQRTTT